MSSSVSSSNSSSMSTMAFTALPPTIIAGNDNSRINATLWRATYSASGSGDCFFSQQPNAFAENCSVDGQQRPNGEIHPARPSRTLECHQKRRGPDQRQQTVFLHRRSCFQDFDRIQSQFPAQSVGMRIHQDKKQKNGGESDGVDSH